MNWCDEHLVCRWAALTRSTTGPPPTDNAMPLTFHTFLLWHIFTNSFLPACWYLLVDGESVAKNNFISFKTDIIIILEWLVRPVVVSATTQHIAWVRSTVLVMLFPILLFWQFSIALFGIRLGVWENYIPYMVFYVTSKNYHS